MHASSAFVDKKSPVYIAAVNASEAFDRINYDVLFQKLFKNLKIIQRGALQCFIAAV